MAAGHFTFPVDKSLFCCVYVCFLCVKCVGYHCHPTVRWYLGSITQLRRSRSFLYGVSRVHVTRSQNFLCFIQGEKKPHSIKEIDHASLDQLSGQRDHSRFRRRDEYLIDYDMECSINTHGNNYATCERHNMKEDLKRSSLSP